MTTPNSAEREAIARQVYETLRPAASAAISFDDAQYVSATPEARDARRAAWDFVEGRLTDAELALQVEAVRATDAQREARAAKVFDAILPVHFRNEGWAYAKAYELERKLANKELPEIEASLRSLHSTAAVVLESLTGARQFVDGALDGTHTATLILRRLHEVEGRAL